MSRIDFHILDDASIKSLMTYACRVTKKAYVNGYKVYLCVDDESTMQALDKLLWTFSELDFIPHSCADREYGQEPVIIGMIEYEADDSTVLINLSRKMSANYSVYARVIELIFDQPESKTAGRERYRQYQQLDNEISNHRVAVN